MHLLHPRMILRRAAAALLALLSACAAPAPGSDEACGFTRVGEFLLTNQLGLPMITIALDGKATRLVLDTGASITTLTQSAAKRLDLRGAGVIRIKAQGIGGNSDATAASPNSFVVAGVSLPERIVMVMPFDLRGFGDPPPDGLLGTDVLAQFDVELDFKSGTGALYRPRNCPAGKPAWTVPFSTLPVIPESPSGRIQIATELNGRRLAAMLDTGATSTIVDIRTAHRLGISDDDLARDRVAQVNGAAAEAAKVHIHTFDTLRIGGEVFFKTALGVVEMPHSSGDMLIGMNYLKGRKLWLSLSSRRIYLSAPAP